MRDPQSNVDVYALGHYEQMQIQLALDYALAALAQRPREDEPDEDPSFNTKTVRGLLKVFAAHGTVTIIRTNDKE